MLTLADRPAPSRTTASPSSLNGEALQRAAFALPVIATLYSAVMALFIAQGLPGNYQLVVLIEVVLLTACIVLVMASGLKQDDWVPILLLFLMIVIAMILSMVNNRLMIETLRATFLIGLFTLVGQRMEARTLDRVFWVVTIAVLGVLVLEIFAQSAYVWTFQPQRFFGATRGIEAAEYNNSGLFNNAGSFEGRFSFGVFDIPRTSSVFMEQVSNANFACVLAIYISARWGALSWPRRALLIGTVCLILISTNGRFAALFVLGVIGGYWIFPLLSRRWLPMFSVVLVAGVGSIYAAYGFVAGDTLIGRLTYAVHMFGEADMLFYLGARASLALAQRDSGYTYVIGSITIFGAIALWAFINFYPRANDAASRRLAWGVVAYMLGQLLVSSTSLFSIKTATLLWAMVGCMKLMPAALPATRKAMA